LQKINKEGSPIKLLVIAVVIGVIAALLTVLYLKTKEAQLRAELTPKVEMRTVIVATDRLLKGTKLSPQVLATRAIPADFLHEEALQPGDFEAIEGKVLVQNVRKGSPILASYVELGFPRDFSDTIDLKRRAMTIQVDELNSIGGFIRPGNKIDLFVSLPADSGLTESDVVMPVLENVEVLATGESAAREYEEKVLQLKGGFDARIDRNFTNITVNVTPKEAAILAQARDKGDLLALLRNRKDQSGSGFEQIAANDLLENASLLAENARVKEAAAAAQGFVVGEDGVIRTKDGVALKNQNLIITEDGTIMTKDGVILSGRGLTVNENGDLVDADGNIVDPDKIRVAADGSLITEDGVVLGGPKGLALTDQALEATSSKGPIVNGKVLVGVTQRADGKLVLPDGTVVDPDDVVIGADGKVRLKDGTLVRGVSTEDPSLETADGTIVTGLKLNEDGMVVLEDGTVVDPKDLVIGSDGKLYTKDGKLVDANVGVGIKGVTVNENGDIVASNGVVLKGAKLNKDGMLVLADGTVVDPNDVMIGADGTVTTKSGKVLKGVTADTSAVAGLAGGTSYSIDYIVGGNSTDGVANVKKVPVESDKK